jgi:TP901 family phage tail tape measure protein
MAKKIFFELEFEGTQKAVERIEQLRSAVSILGKELKSDSLTDSQYTDLEKQLIHAKAALKDLEAERSESVKRFSAAATGDDSYRRLQQTLTELTKQYKELSKVERDSADGILLAKTIENTNTELKKLDAGLGNFQRNVGNYPQTVGAFVTGVADGIPQLQGFADATNIMQNGLQGIGQSATATGRLLTGAFVGFQILSVAASELSEFTEAAIETESGLKELQAITGVTDNELEKLSNNISNLTSITLDNGSRITNTAQDIQNAFKLVGSAQPELLKNSAALEEVTRQAIILQKAGGVDLETAVNLTTTALEQFSLEADQSGRIVNLMAAASKAGSTEIPQLDAALRKAGVGASLAGVSIEETTAAIEIANAKIKNAESSGTALNNFFIKLSASKGLPKEALDQLDKFGISTNVLSDSSATLETKLKALAPIANNTVALSKIFGSESANLAVAKSLIDSAKEAENGSNAFAKMTTTITGTSEGMTAAGVNASALRQRFDNLKNDGINAITPPLTKIIAGFLTLVEVLAKLPKFVYDNKEAFGLLLLAIISFNSQSIITQANIIKENALNGLSAIWKKANTVAQWDLNAAMSANPIGVVIGLIALLVAGFVILYKNSETVRNGINDLTDKFLNFYENLGFFKLAFAPIVETLKFAYNVFKDGGAAIEAYKVAIFSMVINAITYFDILKLKAKEFSLSMENAFSFTATAKAKVSNDLASVRSEIEKSNAKLLNVDAEYNKSLLSGRAKQIAEAKASEEKKKADETDKLPPDGSPDDITKKRKEIKKELDKWKQERIDFVSNLQIELQKIENENYASKLANDLGKEQISFEEKQAKQRENYTKFLEKTKEQEDKLLEAYSKSSIEYKNFKSQTDLSLIQAKNLNDALQVENEELHQKNLLDIQKKYALLKDKEYLDLSKRLSDSTQKLASESTTIALSFLEDRRLAELQQIEILNKSKTESIDKQTADVLEKNKKAQEQIDLAFGKNSEQSVLFQNEVQRSEQDLFRQASETKLKLIEKFNFDISEANKRHNESEAKKEIEDLQKSIQNRTSFEQSETKRLRSELNKSLSNDLSDTERLSLQVNFDTESYEIEKKTLLDNLTDVEKRLNELVSTDTTEVNIAQYKALESMASDYYFKLSEHERNRTEEKRKQSEDRLKIELAEAEEGFNTLQQFATLAQTLSKVSTEQDKRAIDEQVQNKTRSMTDLEQRMKNATGKEKIELQSRIDSEKEGIAKLEAERKKVEKQAAQDAKAFSILQATITTALNVIKALGQAPFPGTNLLAAGIAGAMGAAQIALIAAQPAAEGGLIGANVEPIVLSGERIVSEPNVQTTSSGDNILAVVKKGEVVLNEKQQERLGGYKTFASLGVKGFAEGGRVGGYGSSDVFRAPTESATRVILDKNIIDLMTSQIEATNARIDKIKTYIVLDDLQEVELQQNRIKQQITF